METPKLKNPANKTVESILDRPITVRSLLKGLGLLAVAGTSFKTVDHALDTQSGAAHAEVTEESKDSVVMPEKNTSEKRKELIKSIRKRFTDVAEKIKLNSTDGALFISFSRFRKRYLEISGAYATILLEKDIMGINQKLENVEIDLQKLEQDVDNELARSRIDI